MKMFLYIFFSLIFFYVSTSANNAVPSQTYSIYQQNGYTNPLINQLSNLLPYQQGATTQNPLQQLNVSPSSIKQALLNKLISNPSLQAVFNPTSNSYSSNLAGAENNYIPSNHVNNYAAVPTDHQRNIESNNNLDRKANEITTTEKPKQAKRRRRKPKQKNNNNIKIEESTTVLTIENKPSSKNTTESNKKSKRKNQQQTLDQANLENDTNKTNPARKQKRKRKEQTTTTESPVEEQITTPKRRRKKQKNKNNTEPKGEENVTNKFTEIKENIDLDITTEGKDNENRRARNLNQEHESPKTSPNMTKEITNQFQTNLNQFSHPMMSNWFANFENMYQTALPKPTLVTEVKPKRKRKPKKPKQNKNSNKPSRNTTEIILSTSEAPQITSEPPQITSETTVLSPEPTTTESLLVVEEETPVNVTSNPIEKSLKLLELKDEKEKSSSNDIFEDGYSINEMVDKYVEAGYYDGYIEDYYPFFADSAAYNANNKEIILKNLNDNKYYYTTDKTKRHEDSSLDLLMDYERNKYNYDETEKESIRNAYKKLVTNDVKENLQFRSPPILEKPDFMTREIDKTYFKPEFHYDNINKLIEDKSSSYSSSKSKNSRANINEIKTTPKEVETVYAKSKVVSYGPVYVPSENVELNNTSEELWDDEILSSNTVQNDDNIVFVVATSLGD